MDTNEIEMRLLDNEVKAREDPGKEKAIDDKQKEHSVTFSSMGLMSE